MDSETPERTKLDSRARRARAIILAVMAAFVAMPIILWLLTGAGRRP